MQPNIFLFQFSPPQKQLKVPEMTTQWDEIQAALVNCIYFQQHI